MRVPPALYQIERTLSQQFPTLRPTHQRGLSLWVYGTILAQSACQTAVIAALLTLARTRPCAKRSASGSMMALTKLPRVRPRSTSTTVLRRCSAGCSSSGRARSLL